MSSPNNGNQTQAQRYAQAVVQAMVERWQGTLSQVSQAIRNNGDLSKTLHDGNRSVDERFGALQSKIDGDISPEAQNLLKLLIQEDDLNLLSSVADALANLTSGRSGPSRVEITSAVPLTDDEKRQLQEKLSAEHGEGLLYDFRVNEALHGRPAHPHRRQADGHLGGDQAGRAMRERLTSAV